MISKSKISLIRSLHLSKFRNQHRKFIAEGPKIVGELLESSFSVYAIFATPEWISRQPDIKKVIEFTEVNDKELSRISTQKSPNQVLAVVDIPEPNKQIPGVKDFVLLLDEIKDPGNMGTIIRTADWFGIQYIVCSENCVDIYNPKVVQSAMGSIFRIPVYYTDPVRYFEKIEAGTQIFGAMLDGNSIYSVGSGKSGIIIIGNESHGISSRLLPYITTRIRIPEYSRGNVFAAESLNASLAAAVICAEFKRRSETENQAT